MLIDIQTSLPPFKVMQKTAADELKKRMAIESPAVSRLLDMASAQSGIENRSLVIPDGDINAPDKFFSNETGYFSPGTKDRMLRYEEYGTKMVIDAVENIFQTNNVNPADITRIVTISCTGFFAPGIDYQVCSHFKLNQDIKRMNIGFMGCAASIIGFNNILDVLSNTTKEENILLISLEICSIHLQLEPTRDNIMSNMIFADGCAAALFSNKELLNPKMKLIKTESILFSNSAEFMGWKVGNNGFEMLLSAELPKIILNEATPKVLEIISNYGIDKSSIKYWALHPGGRAILDSLQKGLDLTEDEMCFSRTVLRNNGNMSSVSILFVLKEILSGINLKKGEYTAAIAFGPGLTMEVALFEGVD